VKNFRASAKLIKNPEWQKIYSIQWKLSGHTMFFRASASCSKILNREKVFNAVYSVYNHLGVLLLSELLKPLLCRTRSRGWCWAAIQLSHRPEPCSPLGGRLIGYWRTTCSTVCLSWTQALLGRVNLGRWVPVSGMKMQRLVGEVCATRARDSVANATKLNRLDACEG